MARTAQLLAVAALPALAGISRAHDAAAFGHGFRIAMLACTGLLAAAGGLALLGPRARPVPIRHDAPERVHCPISSPPAATPRLGRSPAWTSPPNG